MIKYFPYKSILVACSVGVARSPMAVGFLKDFFSKRNLNIEVFSGGIASNARDGMLISLDAKLVMKELGIKLSDSAESFDLKKHKDLIKKAELILTLTNQHKQDLLKFQEIDNKDIYTLKEFAGESGDIEDPSMKGIEGFRLIRDEIKDCLMKGLQKSLGKN